MSTVPLVGIKIQTAVHLVCHAFQENILPVAIPLNVSCVQRVDFVAALAQISAPVRPVPRVFLKITSGVQCVCPVFQENGSQRKVRFVATIVISTTLLIKQNSGNVKNVKLVATQEVWLEQLAA